MNRFWEIIMEPCLTVINAKRIVEIGSDNGYGTKKLIEYCKQNSGETISIDPFPKYDYKEWEKENEGIFTLYTDLSLSRLPLLKKYDAILIDGDHNWYTVYNELKIIKDNFNEDEFPLIFLHDIDWPYARRDLYYNPENIPYAYRQAHEKKGIIPGKLNLVETGGLNDHLNNAIYENNLQNGVRTAVEDFLKELENKDKIKFFSVPGFFGLGIIYNEDKHSKIADIINNKSIGLDIIKKIELERIEAIIKNTNLQRINHNLQEENHNLQEENHNLKELYVQVEKLNLLNNKISREYDDSRFREKEAVAQNEKLIALISEKEKEINDLNNRISDKDKKIKKLINDINIHLSSIKYNLGDAIIKGMRPSIDTIKMPIRIFRLFRQGIQKKKKQNTKSNLVMKDEYEKEKVEIINKQRQEISKRSLVEIQEDKQYIENIIKDNYKILKLQHTPLISIITVNHNGQKHLYTFFESIIKNVSYRNLEIVIVDNASEDDSIMIINEYSKQLNIKLIQNKNNESYSYANNQGVEIASGEYLLFANNDIEVFEGWLEELLHFTLNNNGVGAVGSLLYYPECPEESVNRNKSFSIQHCGIKFNRTEERMIPYNYLNGESPKKASSEPINIAAVTGASLLIAKEKFLQVGGFTEEYIYGYEDVDLNLKLIKKGYKNYIIPTSRAYHFEFGTQEKQHSSHVSKRRKNNIKIFKSRWENWLQKKYKNAVFEVNNIFFDVKLKVAFAVTEAGEDVSAGDYFTAMEFGEAMKRRGWEIEFLKRKGPEDWYKVSDDVDIVISLLDAYDITKIKCNNNKLITVAWARNWFDRWASKSYIDKYTYIVASSEIACEYMEGIIGRKVHLLKIASNAERFLNIKSNLELDCDYCFTGSYWNDPREIIDILNPQKYSQYKFNIYGANWDKIEKLAPFNRGFVSYKTMPEIYASTKIVVDDANRVTKPYGSVNSRVFDALASGVLVLTNGILGSEYTFNKELPTYSSEKELYELINYYINNEDERISLVNRLQKNVLENHTYDKRVDELLDIFGYEIPRKSIIIKTPVPKAEIAQAWGDYHFALALIKEFEEQGYDASFQYLNQWNDDDSYADLIFVLRGLSKYDPKEYHYNIMWNISHPDKISIEEYYSYDQVYIASKKWTQHIKEQAINKHTKIDTLMQCADISVFKPEEINRIAYELLFVGNSRKVHRKIIEDVIPSKYELSVYGGDWEKIISEKYIKGKNIPNQELYKYYSGAKIVLNDHWDDMRDKGFISNRIFDVLASKGFVITDEVVGLEDYFGDSVVTYKDKVDLEEKIELYMNNEQLRQAKIQKGYEIVVENHTFEQRVNKIINEIQNSFEL